MEKTKYKICGITCLEDVEAIKKGMPDYIGIILGYRKSHRCISLEQARVIRESIREIQVKVVGVFVDAEIKDIVSICEEGIIDMVQLHGQENQIYLQELRKKIEIPILQAFVIKTQEDVACAEQSLADDILLDGGRGEGKIFPHHLLVGIKRPYFLAGGITPDNLPEILSRYHPFAVDMSSGVERDGKKDGEKISQVSKIIQGMLKKGEYIV